MGLAAAGVGFWASGAFVVEEAIARRAVPQLASDVIVMKTTALTRSQRIILSIVGMAILCTAGVGCNTVRGFGRDVERTGEKIEAGVKR